MVKVAPVANEEPPEATAYQFNVPALPEAPSTREPASHREAGVIELITVEPIIAVTAILGEIQFPTVAST